MTSAQQTALDSADASRVLAGQVTDMLRRRYASTGAVAGLDSITAVDIGLQVAVLVREQGWRLLFDRRAQVQTTPLGQRHNAWREREYAEAFDVIKRYRRAGVLS